MASAGLIGLLGLPSCDFYRTKEFYHDLNVEIIPGYDPVQFRCKSTIHILKPDLVQPAIPLDGQHVCESKPDKTLKINAFTSYKDNGHLKRLSYKLCSEDNPSDCIKGSCTQAYDSSCGKAFQAVDDFVDKKLKELK